MTTAVPVLAITLAEGKQLWQIMVIVMIKQEGQADRFAAAGEVEVQVSKQLLLTNPIIGTKNTDKDGRAVFDGNITDGEYIITARHKAMGVTVKGSILCPQTGAWSYHTGTDWYFEQATTVS